MVALRRVRRRLVPSEEPNRKSWLKPGQRLEALGRIAQAESDTAAARRMQRAKQKLFASFRSANTPC